MSLTEEELAAVLDMPAMEAPEGVEPDFDNPPNENGLALAIITVTLAIGTLCVLLRAYGRVYLLRKVGIEERKYGSWPCRLPLLTLLVLIICAYGVYVGQAYCCYALIETPGYFVHQWNLKLGQLIPTSFVRLPSKHQDTENTKHGLTPTRMSSS